MFGIREHDKEATGNACKSKLNERQRIRRFGFTTAIFERIVQSPRLEAPKATAKYSEKGTFDFWWYSVHVDFPLCLADPYTKFDSKAQILFIAVLRCARVDDADFSPVS